MLPPEKLMGAVNGSNLPLITVVVAVRNCAGTLLQCLQSVTGQTYPFLELVVIDGASNDGTLEVVTQCAPMLSYWESAPDSGIYSSQAWNKALAKSRGDWICFLGADDYLFGPEVMSQVASYLGSALEDTRIVYGQIALVNTNGEEIYTVGEPWMQIKQRFKETMCLPHAAVMHRRSLFELRGNFDETYAIAGDYELLLRELKTRDARFIPGVVVAAVRQGGVSSNPKNTVFALGEVLKAQRKAWAELAFLAMGVGTREGVVKRGALACLGEMRMQERHLISGGGAWAVLHIGPRHEPAQSSCAG